MKGFMTKADAKLIWKYVRENYKRLPYMSEKDMMDDFESMGWINPTIIESAKSKVEDTVDTIKEKWEGEEGEKVREIAKDVAGKAKKTFTNFLEKVKQIDETLDKDK